MIIKTLEQFRALVSSHKEAAKKTLAGFATDLGIAPVAAIRQSAHYAIDAAAKLQVAVDIIDLIDDGERNETPSLASIVELLQKRLVSDAIAIRSRSTSGVANALDDAAVAYLASILDNRFAF